MTITKEPDTKGVNGLGLLNAASQALCLQLKIGKLGLELWNFPNEETQSCVRLIYDRDVYDVLGDNCQQEREGL